MPMMSPKRVSLFPSGHDELSFLPNFCHARVLLVMLLLGQLLALTLSLSTPGLTMPDASYRFFWTSAFIHGVTLASLVILCASRPLLERLPATSASVAAMSVAPVVTVATSLAILTFSGHAPGGHGVVFVFRNMLISVIVSALTLRYFYVQHSLKRTLEIQAEFRIQALQARIRPHFLFNSLNTIVSLISSRPNEAEVAVEDLADLFRATLTERTQVTLREELRITRRYIHIESLRLGDRLRIEWDMDNLPHDAVIPTLILQPLVENAIYHGIQPRPQGGAICVKGELADGALRIVVNNPVPEDRNFGDHKGNRMAQENIRQRLNLAYGKEAAMMIDNCKNSYTVTLTLPYRRAIS